MAEKTLDKEKNNKIEDIVMCMMGGSMPRALSMAIDSKLKHDEIKEYVSLLLEKGNIVKAADAISKFAELDKHHQEYQLTKEELESFRPKVVELIKQYVQGTGTFSRIIVAFGFKDIVNLRV